MNWIAVLIGKLLEKIKDPREALLYASSIGLIIFLTIKLSKSDETLNTEKSNQHKECIRRLNKCEEGLESISEKLDSIVYKMIEYKIELELIKKQSKI